MENNKKITYHLYFIIALICWFVVYYNVLVNMLGVWSGSETYKHCYLILPIVLYLLYENKTKLSTITFNVNYWPLLLLAVGQFIFLLVDLAGINVLSQFAAYGSLVCLVFAIYGWRFFKAIIFPLAYLVLAVPMGEELVPLLQEITADISVYLVQLVGIPIYREGLYLYIPNGTFEVAEACSGIRFLISMISIGLLYAYLFYQSTWRRLVFIGLSILIPILANGVRAFGIIYIGHKSDMQHAVGADHLVYGWFFFAMVLFLLMMIGKFWREDVIGSKSVDNDAKQVQQNNRNISLLFFIVMLPVLFIQPLYQHFIVGSINTNQTSSSLLTYIKENPSASQEITTLFEPSFINADHYYVNQLSVSDDTIEMYVAQYLQDSEGQELINGENELYNIDKFSLVDEHKISINTEQGMINAKWLKLVSVFGKQQNLIYWYEVGDVRDYKALTIKKAQLLAKLSGQSGGGNIVILSIENDARIEKKPTKIIEALPWL